MKYLILFINNHKLKSFLSKINRLILTKIEIFTINVNELIMIEIYIQQ